MDTVEFVYTVEMDDAEVREHLRAGHTGVLSLTDGERGYGIPISYHLDGDRLLLRLSHDGDSRKTAMLTTTGEVSFVCYGADATGGESWSVFIAGPLARLPETDYDDADLNRWFPPLRVFDEAIDEVAISVYVLALDHVDGRRTVA